MPTIPICNRHRRRGCVWTRENALLSWLSFFLSLHETLQTWILKILLHRGCHRRVVEESWDESREDHDRSRYTVAPRSIDYGRIIPVRDRKCVSTVLERLQPLPDSLIHLKRVKDGSDIVICPSEGDDELPDLEEFGSIHGSSFHFAIVYRIGFTVMSSSHEWSRIHFTLMRIRESHWKVGTTCVVKPLRA